jgi:hypothetical protein
MEKKLNNIFEVSGYRVIGNYKVAGRIPGFLMSNEKGGHDSSFELPFVVASRFIECVMLHQMRNFRNAVVVERKT